MAELMKLEERVIFSLRKLYQSYGYQQFKMSKFEPYDFYMQNKEFLFSQRVITFNDTDGTLMALKPDVTLSIVKNYRPTKTGTQKVCYSENIYRIAGAGKTYREIMQTGLECLGMVGPYERSEVVLLAMKSLECISEKFVLDLSHLGVLNDIFSQGQLSEEVMEQALVFMEEKNESALQKMETLPQSVKNQLLELLYLSGPITEAVGNLPEFIRPEYRMQLCRLGEFLCEMGYAHHAFLDFSIGSNRDYYNGFVFRGYVKGVPSEVLAGGQYDCLMEKMGKQAGGIGFAVYLDQLELLDRRMKDCGADIILVCNPQDKLSEIHQIKSHFGEKRVLVTSQLPTGPMNCRILKLENGRVTEIENDG